MRFARFAGTSYHTRTVRKVVFSKSFGVDAGNAFTIQNALKLKGENKMNTKNAKKATKAGENAERTFIEVREHEIKNVRVVDGRNGDVVFFTLMLNGVTIYNCRVATGKNGDFISFPQYKGSNGTYYNNVYASLSDEDSAKILDEIQKAIDEQ